jgi:hypothetical protein
MATTPQRDLPSATPKEGGIDSSVGQTMIVNGYRGQRKQLAFP